MAYITRQDLEERIGESELIVLSDREGTGAVNTAVVDKAISDATDEINMHLGTRYQLPLAEVPATIKRLAVNIALYWLSDSDATISDLVNERYESSVKTLKALASGAMTLGLPTLQKPAETTAGDVQLVGDGRITSRKTLGGVI
ncbi:DUF1320 domain-containing protein [Candidatus Sororendozoicomonas aggregata]|uniref:gp436 family protein n=1 Tax=Candidatus Sororendozoicomonas aggregata TaxID=3073239 RepID=UPI002ED46EEC